MKSNLTKYLGAIILLCVSVTYSRADALITNPGPGQVAVASGNNTLGFDFTVGAAPLSVTALGLWDQGQNGFLNAHTIGLWDNLGNLLVSATVSAGTGNFLQGDFRYVNLVTSVLLMPGTTYVLGTSYLGGPGDDEVVANTSGNQATFDPAVLPGNWRYVQFTGFAFPSLNAGLGSVVGPNLLFGPVGVPETGPGVLIIGLVFAGLVCLQRWHGINVTQTVPTTNSAA